MEQNGTPTGQPTGEPTGEPFGNTRWGEDTGCRFKGMEIRVGMDFVERDIWRICATGKDGLWPHRPYLTASGQPAAFDSYADAFDSAIKRFITVGTITIGKRFRFKEKWYRRVLCRIGQKDDSSSVYVLDEGTYIVSRMAQDAKPDAFGNDEGGVLCELQSSASPV